MRTKWISYDARVPREGLPSQKPLKHAATRNSLIRPNYSLISRKHFPVRRSKFPVQLSREFAEKTLRVRALVAVPKADYKPETAKFPVFFPVRGRERFARDCVHRQRVCSEPLISPLRARIALSGAHEAAISAISLRRAVARSRGEYGAIESALAATAAGLANREANQCVGSALRWTAPAVGGPNRLLRR